VHGLLRLLRSFLKHETFRPGTMTPRDPFRLAWAYAQGDRKLFASIVREGRHALPGLVRRAFWGRVLSLWGLKAPP
jgi:hypothetical protein